MRFAQSTAHTPLVTVCVALSLILAGCACSSSTDPSESGDEAPVERYDSTKCKAAEGCSTDGQCTADEEGNCYASNDKDCLKSERCGSHGDCHAIDRACRAKDNKDCESAFWCVWKGWCTAVSPTPAAPSGCGPWAPCECAVTSDADCAKSVTCVEDGNCSAVPFEDTDRLWCRSK
jgi:hypothetical protein